MTAAELKRAAARAALHLVRPGMRIGIGTGSTAYEFVELLGERVRGGLDIVGVPTSEATRRQAEGLGIVLSTLDQTPELDLDIDGADEIGPGLQLIKGGGGALLREKIVAAASRRMVVIADASKHVAALGAFPLPIEVAPFGARSTEAAIVAVAAAHGCSGPIRQRMAADGHAFVTDGGHIILDAAFDLIADARALGLALSQIPGVVEHGLFIDMADLAYIAGPDGVQEVHRSQPRNENAR